MTSSPELDISSHSLALKLSVLEESTSSFSPRSGSPASPGQSPRSPPPTCRTPRGAVGWRPVMPGYRAPVGGEKHKSVVITKTVEVQHNVNSGGEGEKSLRDSIPRMPRSLAIVCFVLNVLVPGSGTLISAFSVFCGSKPRPRDASKLASLWVNLWVALLQALTTLLFLLGWIWSVMWGSAFLSISVSVDSDDEDMASKHQTEGEDALTSRLARTRGAENTTTRTTTTTRVDFEGTTDMSFGSQQNPIIVLQEAPVIIQPDPPPPPPRAFNRRHQRILRRQNTEPDLLPQCLIDAEALENIVIRNMPVPGGTGGGISEVQVAGFKPGSFDSASTSGFSHSAGGSVSQR